MYNTYIIHIYVYAYIYMYIIFQILFRYRLVQDIECSSLCYTVGPCCLFYILYCVYVNPKLLIYLFVDICKCFSRVGNEE